MATVTVPAVDGTVIGDDAAPGGALRGYSTILSGAAEEVFGEPVASPAANTVLARLKDIVTAITALSGNVDGLEALATSLNGYVDTLETLIGTTNTSLTALSSYVDGLEALLGTLNGYVDGLESLQGSTNTAIAGLATLITTLNGYVDGLETALAGVLTEATFIARIPTLGQKAQSGSISVTLASNQTLPAGEAFIGQVGSPVDLIDVTLTLDTNAYADGDLLADTQAVAGALRVSGGRSLLQSLTVHDEDDVGQAIDLVFLGASTSLGTENVAPSISDAGARDILGIVPVASADFKDLGGVKIATKTSIGLLLKAATGTTIYVAAIIRGAGTYTASGIRLRLGILQA